MGMGGSGGFRPPESEIPYPDPSQTRCPGKILTKKRVFKAFLSDFQTCLRHFLQSCPTQIFGAAHIWTVIEFFIFWLQCDANFIEKFFYYHRYKSAFVFQ